ncbi:hypothetical protein GGI22_007410, partial [Coemansia erecta]
PAPSNCSTLCLTKFKTSSVRSRTRRKRRPRPLIASLSYAATQRKIQTASCTRRKLRIKAMFPMYRTLTLT